MKTAGCLPQDLRNFFASGVCAIFIAAGAGSGALAADSQFTETVIKPDVFHANIERAERELARDVLERAAVPTVLGADRREQAASAGYRFAPVTEREDAAMLAQYEAAPRIDTASALRSDDHPNAFVATQERDDREASLFATLMSGRNPEGAAAAEATCILGVPSAAHTEPAAACFTAYKSFVQDGRFDRALEVAATGCEKYGEHNDCLRAARVPLVMNNQDLAIPVEFAALIGRLGEHVCFTGHRYKNLSGIDVTGRTCEIFARHFGAARDPEYAASLSDPGRAYYASVHKPDFALRLSQAACKHGYNTESCGPVVQNVAQETPDRAAPAAPGISNLAVSK
jgi:hypothetical protein